MLFSRLFGLIGGNRPHRLSRLHGDDAQLNQIAKATGRQITGVSLAIAGPTGHLLGLGSLLMRIGALSEEQLVDAAQAIADVLAATRQDARL